MSQKLNSSIAVLGIDIGKNSFHIVGLDNFMMHLLVRDVDAWWSHVRDQDIAAKYGVMIEPISDKPWGLRDFAISDPSYVLWRIGQNIGSKNETK